MRRSGACSRQLVTSFSYVWLSGQLLAFSLAPAIMLWKRHPKVLEVLGWIANKRAHLSERYMFVTLYSH